MPDQYNQTLGGRDDSEGREERREGIKKRGGGRREGDYKDGIKGKGERGGREVINVFNSHIHHTHIHYHFLYLNYNFYFLLKLSIYSL